MIRLVCIDVDGTLVGSSGTVLPAVWAAAARARAAGIRLAICSGRPGFGYTRDFAGRLDKDGWHVFQNGASVVHLQTGRSLSAMLPTESVAALVARARGNGRILELYTDTDYVVESTAARARQHARLLGIPFAPHPFESLGGRIVRAQWLLPHDEERAVLAEPHPGLELSSSVSPVMADTLFLNMTSAGVDKAYAVRAIAAQYDFPLAQVMFVGDGSNDVSAMREVGLPVAMANADPDVHAVARRTVGHVDDAGLAEALDLAVATRSAAVQR
jgi:Cof subfamily protein (haloacid dehalogenase superfamily)